MSLPLSFNFIQQLIDALALFFNSIADEVNFRRTGQIQRKTELLPNIRGRALQRRERLLMLFFITADRDVDTSRLFVSRKPNISYRDCSQARIFKFITNDLRNFIPQNIRNSFCSAHTYSSVAATRSTM